MRIPEGVTTFGAQAFFCCVSLREVSLPASLTEVEENPFGNCPALERVEVAEGNPALYMNGQMLMNARTQTLLTYLCGSPAQFAIVPEGTRRISDHAFTGCVSLRQITLPEGLIAIDNGAFSACASLRSVNLPGSLQDMGADLFSGCVKVNVQAPRGSEAEKYIRRRPTVLQGD